MKIKQIISPFPPKIKNKLKTTSINSAEAKIMTLLNADATKYLLNLRRREEIIFVWCRYNEVMNDGACFTTPFIHRLLKGGRSYRESR